MGIKSKVQKKGWTGIWHKIESQRLINGWEVLNFKETWKYNYFGPDFNPNKNNLPDFRCYPETWKDLDYTTSNYLKKDWITFNIMGADLDFSQKDKVTGLWHAAKNAGKTTVDYLNDHFTESSNNQLEAIRIAPNNKDTKTTCVSLGPYEKRVSYNRNHTIIITKSTGFKIGFSTNTDGKFSSFGAEAFAGEGNILPNSILYCAGCYDDEWVGVMITFKE